MPRFVHMSEACANKSFRDGSSPCELMLMKASNIIGSHSFVKKPSDRNQKTLSTLHMVRARILAASRTTANV